MHYTAWSLEWIPSLPYAQHLDSKVPVNGQHLMWDLSVIELLVIKKIRNWGTLEKLPNREVRHQCLWVTAEIKCSALFKYETFWIKLYLIIWILYLRKLSWMFCSPIGSKTNALTWHKKNRVAFKNVAKIICMYTFPLPRCIHKHIHVSTVHLTFWEKSKKEMEQLAFKGLS